MAQRTSVTIIALGHFNKRSDVNSLGRVGGAVATNFLERSAILPSNTVSSMETISN